MQPVTRRSLEVAALHAVIGLEVADDRLDRLTTPELASFLLADPLGLAPAFEGEPPQNPGRFSSETSSATRLERIERSVERIDRLIDQFLQQDRIEASNWRLNFRPVNLLDLCNEVVLQAKTSDRLSVLGADVWALADQALLTMLLNNLVDNAIKYASDDSAIVVRVWRDPNGAHISVTDGGPGLPRNVQDQIFQRYVRGQGHGHLPGSGLGLYLCQRIAKMHMGQLSYAPMTPNGAIFTLHFTEKQGEGDAPRSGAVPR
jgi:signal transduction histidine kinase